MQLLLALSTLFLASIPVSRASTSLRRDSISNLPSCAFTCLISGLSTSTCSATDITCQCSDKIFNAGVESCVLKGCTLTTQNITSTICGIQPRDHSYVIGVLGLTGGTLALSAVVLRCIARLKYLGGTFWWDDWTIIFVAALIAPFTALSYIASIGRLGKDIWAIPLDDIIVFFHQFYFAEVLYAAIMPFTKTSILFFYLRIFPGFAFRRITWCLIAITGLTGATFVLVNALQCTPASHYWEQWRDYPGKCISPSGPAWSVSVIGIILDFLMLSLPIYQLRELNLPWQKRLHASLMFGVGFFVTIVSILRLQSLVHFRNTTNPTYDYYSIGYWSIVEVNIGVICACMPSIRVLLVFVYSKVTGQINDLSPFHSVTPTTGSFQVKSSNPAEIHRARSDSIEYSSRSDRNGSSFIKLVDIADVMLSKSNIGTRTRIGGEESLARMV